MNPQEREQAAERWLDEAIDRFRQAGPRDGIESRLIAGLRAHAAQRQRRWTFLLSGAAATVLVTTLVASFPRNKPASTNVTQQLAPSPAGTIPPSPMAAAHQPPALPRLPMPAHRAPESGKSKGEITLPVTATKQDVFPTPAPPSEQGKRLQAYLRHTPQHELTLVAGRQIAATGIPEINDLSIASIEIKELNPAEDREQH
jgi:hypothetical protein